MDDQEQLKTLRKESIWEANEQRRLLAEIQELQAELEESAKRKRRIEGSIKTLMAKQRPLKVSDHAIVRYFERVKGFDMAKIKAKIVPEKTEKSVKEAGLSGDFDVKTHRLVVRGGTVVTVKPKRAPRKARKRAPKPKIERRIELEKLQEEELLGDLGVFY